ncbi:MAG: nuclease-related domain-containing protein [Actinomycetota bacterium]
MEPRLEDYFVQIKEILVGRKPGLSAAVKARELRGADPFGFALSLLLRRHTDERAWRKGANGERRVGFVLGRLPEGWHVFHDVPVGERGANIDHVVVGPTGTFTLNAKNLTGKVWVGPQIIRHNGHPTSFLPKAVHEARRASRLLTAAIGRPVDVRGGLAILADEWTITEKPADVHVAGPRGVKDWMLRLPATLAPHEVIAIAAAASKPSTWTALA